MDQTANKTNTNTPSLRRKSVPQHCSLELNMSLTSIVKTPKYSSNGDHKLQLDAPKTTSRTRLTKSMPLIRSSRVLQVKKISTTDSENVTWLTSGVEFQNRVEVYFYKEYH
jgi:hypothetical protein